MNEDVKYSILSELSLVKRSGMPALLEWLRDDKCELGEGGFFSAPASTQYHLSDRGGLAQHSWNVYQALQTINDKWNGNFTWDEMRVAALLHDVCKVNFYVREVKRARTADGQWVDKEGWTVRDAEPLGHGEKSVIVLSRFIKLTLPEQMAIRWHMGRWDAEGGQVRTMSQAMDAHKLVTALQLADVVAARLVEA